MTTTRRKSKREARLRLKKKEDGCIAQAREELFQLGKTGYGGAENNKGGGRKENPEKKGRIMPGALQHVPAGQHKKLRLKSGPLGPEEKGSPPWSRRSVSCLRVEEKKNRRKRKGAGQGPPSGRLKGTNLYGKRNKTTCGGKERFQPEKRGMGR